MVYRYSWVAAVGGIALALVRLQDLVQSSSTGAPWQFVVVAAAVLGGIITWTALAYRLNAVLVVLINAAALLFTSMRIAVPDTTAFLLPTGGSFTALRAELGYAVDVIRSGVAPVIPASGLVVVIAAVFWGLGALAVWGLRSGRPFVALTPPVLLYLQLATADRGSFAGPVWAVGLLVLVAGSLLAVTLDERATTGRLSRTRAAAAGGVVSGPSLGTIAFAVVVALVGATGFAGTVPATGLLDWRQSSGLTGNYFGSVSYNPFVSIQKSLVSQRDIPVFEATISGDAAVDRVYWRLLSLDTFNGVWWYAQSPEVDRIDETEWEDEDHRFAGEQADVTADVTILQLRNDWLPTVYSTGGVTVDEEEIERNLRIAPDGSVRFGSGSFRGMRYSVAAQVPQPDLRVMATTTEGAPTRVFADAVAAGAIDVPAERPAGRELPPGSDRYLELPEDLDPAIAALAADVTFGLESSYERGLAIESFLRNPANGFTYSTEVPPGDSRNDLASWLLDPASPEYRLGYCEQYATAMGVLARAAGVPSRVVLGFTPGRPLGEDRVVVLDTNAHAWVELWMPEQGWVRFDPTPRSDGVNPSTVDDLESVLGPGVRALLEVERPEAPDFAGSPLPPALFPEDFPERITPGAGGTDEDAGASLPNWLPGLAVVVAALLVLFAAVPALKAWRRRRRLRRLREGDIGAAWAEITDRLTDLGEAPHPSQTPLEYAAGIDDALHPLAEVYSAAVYGGDGASAAMVTVAERSLTETEATTTLRYSPTQRLLARYRLRSVLPAWAQPARVRAFITGKNGRNGNGRRR